MPVWISCLFFSLCGRRIIPVVVRHIIFQTQATRTCHFETCCVSASVNALKSVGELVRLLVARLHEGLECQWDFPESDTSDLACIRFSAFVIFLLSNCTSGSMSGSRRLVASLLFHHPEDKEMHTDSTPFFVCVWLVQSI